MTAGWPPPPPEPTQAEKIRARFEGRPPLEKTRVTFWLLNGESVRVYLDAKGLSNEEYAEVIAADMVKAAEEVAWVIFDSTIISPACVTAIEVGA